MRISDWSSDVCSSDLGELGVKVPLNGRLYTRYLDERVIYSLMEDFDIFSLSTKELHTSGLSDGIEAFKATYAFSEKHGDRKSVVKGKRWSERVDRGGRLIIKKNRIKKSTIQKW